MAFLGDIFIAGTECLSGAYNCGIAYLLSSKSPISYVYETKKGTWQVEFTKNSSEVVARVTLPVSYDELQVNGFTAIQEALDILSIKGLLSAHLVDPTKFSVGVYCSNEKSILYVHSLLDFPIDMRVEVKQTDALGNEIKLPLPIDPIWNESFRYYRLSQSSSDLFEAYRNLFLAFEALLNFIFPKKNSEKEGVWLKRCLSGINNRISLAQFTPMGKENPVDYIIVSQYKNIRCELQHAKFPDATLPHSNISPTDVKQAYSELVRIWRQIAGTYLNVPISGGLMTYVGFEIIMANAFNDGVAIYYTPDKTPPLISDISVSSNGSSVYEFSTSNYLGQVKPGVVRIIARENISKLPDKYGDPIYRISTNTKSDMFGITYVGSGLIISGVDEWEFIYDIRLINSSQPKTEFTT